MYIIYINRSLLVTDPCKRPSVVELLKHEWIAMSTTKISTEVLTGTVSRMRDFNDERRNIIKSGYMFKQGHIVKNWKKRSFELTR